MKPACHCSAFALQYCQAQERTAAFVRGLNLYLCITLQGQLVRELERLDASRLGLFALIAGSTRAPDTSKDEGELYARFWHKHLEARARCDVVDYDGYAALPLELSEVRRCSGSRLSMLSACAGIRLVRTLTSEMSVTLVAGNSFPE